MRIAALAVMLLFSCSSPEKRIQKRPEVFAAFPAQAQEKIRRGEVELGFSPEMVRMALGPPDRRYERRAGAGRELVWGYGETEGRGLHAGLGGEVMVGGGGSGTFGVLGVGLGSRPAKTDKRRIVFREDKVASIEDQK
ncbi:MAG: hypothetical protein HY925_06070 [Elusimicrobia bacterium]|nr:hypothetical protein [Elusimicrobiota bacterium]